MIIISPPPPPSMTTVENFYKKKKENAFWITYFCPAPIVGSGSPFPKFLDPFLFTDKI